VLRPFQGVGPGAGSQPLIERIAVEAKPGSHHADGMEGEEWGVFVCTRHHKRVQRSEHTHIPVTSVIRSQIRQSAARFEGTQDAEGTLSLT